jgi:AcrR family transcriptional regulator
MVDGRTSTVPRQATRARIVEVAAQLLHDHGPPGVTTRAVAQAAGVQAPTIYRFFADKDALLDAVTEHVFAGYVATKARTAHQLEPLDDLRAGWDTHVGFGLANPALFALLADPVRGRRSPAAEAGLEVLRARVHRVAATGRLRVAEERAVQLIAAAGTGAVLTLLAQPPQARQLDLADAMYDAVMRTILTEPAAREPHDPTAAVVVAFRAVAPTLPTLTPAERALIAEWLERPQ